MYSMLRVITRATKSGRSQPSILNRNGSPFGHKPKLVPMSSTLPPPPPIPTPPPPSPKTQPSSLETSSITQTTNQQNQIQVSQNTSSDNTITDNSSLNTSTSSVVPPQTTQSPPTSTRHTSQATTITQSNFPPTQQTTSNSLTSKTAGIEISPAINKPPHSTIEDILSEIRPKTSKTSSSPQQQTKKSIQYPFPPHTNKLVHTPTLPAFTFSDPITTQNWLDHLIKYTERHNTPGILAVRDFCRAQRILSTQTYNKIISHFVHDNNDSIVRSLLVDMERDRIPCDFYTYFSMLTHAHNTSDMEWFDDLVARLRTLPIPGDLRMLIFNTRVKNALKRNNQLVRLQEVFDEMKQQGLAMDDFTYSTLIDHYAHSKQFERCIGIYKRMLAAGVRPSQPTFLSLMASSNNEEELEVVKKEMREIGMFMGIENYNYQIHQRAKNGDFDGCRAIMRSIVDAGLTPDSVSYNPIITAHAKSGDMDQCLAVMQEMFQKGIQPDQKTYGIIASGFASHGQFDKAQELVEVMRKKDMPVFHALTSIADNMIRQGQAQEGLQIFGKLIEEGVASTATYNSVMSALVEVHEYSTVLHVYNLMKENGVRPDHITYYALVLHSCHTRQDPYQWMPKIVEDNVTISGFLYNTFVLRSLGPPARDLRTLQEMWEQGFIPEPRCFDKVMRHASRIGDPDTCVKLLEAMRAHGIADTPTAYTLIIAAYANISRKEEVAKWLAEMRAKGLGPEDDTFNVLLDFYFKAKDLDICIELLQEMEDRGVTVPDSWRFG